MRWSAKWALRLGAIVAGLLGVAFVAFFFTVGGITISMGIHEFHEDSALAAHGRSAIGTVVEKRTIHTSPMGGTVQKMAVRFTTSDGVVHQVWVNGDDPVGHRARIRYDPAAPDTAVSESNAVRILLGGFVVITGVTLIIGPPGLLLKIAWEAFSESRQSRREKAAA